MDNTNETKILCPFCGKEVKNTDGFCEHCDAYLHSSNSSSKSTKKQCNNCKSYIPKSSAFCPNCGKNPNMPANSKKCISCGCYIPKSSYFCPNCGKNPNTPSTSSYSTPSYGTFWGGFFLTFFLGLLGLIFAFCFGQEETKRGAKHGFIWLIIISVCLGVIVGCAYADYIEKLLRKYR